MCVCVCVCVSVCCMTGKLKQCVCRWIICIIAVLVCIQSTPTNNGAALTRNARTAYLSNSLSAKKTGSRKVLKELYVCVCVCACVNEDVYDSVWFCMPYSSKCYKRENTARFYFGPTHFRDRNAAAFTTNLYFGQTFSHPDSLISVSPACHL